MSNEIPRDCAYDFSMTGHECYHCKQWIPAGVEHDCWTTTEYALTRGLSEDLRDAWERLRETLAEFGEQRIYASHHSIMFARKACYCFVRPQRARLEVVFFLSRTIKAPMILKAKPTSRIKVAHVVYVVHRDQVERPLTDWLEEAYHFEDAAVPKKVVKKIARKKVALKKATRKKTPSKSSRARRAALRQAQGTASVVKR